MINSLLESKDIFITMFYVAINLTDNENVLVIEKVMK